MRVQVKHYDKIWKKEFEILRRIYEEHVGSTSIEGLCAKPIIDVDIIVDNYGKLNEIVENLELLGYNQVGNLGIVGREWSRYARKWN